MVVGFTQPLLHSEQAKRPRWSFYRMTKVVGDIGWVAFIWMFHHVA